MSQPRGQRGGQTYGGGGRGGAARGHGGGSSHGGRGKTDKVPEVYRTPSGAIPAPNPEVTKVENAFIQQSTGVKAVGGISLHHSFPLRPGHGTQGTPITVYANYFELTATKDLSFYRYHVDVKAEGGASTPSKLKTKQLFTLLLEHSDYRGVVTDYASVLLSRKKLAKVPDSVLLPLRAQGTDEAPENPAVYKLDIQETGTVLVSDLIEWLKSIRRDIPAFGQRNEVLQALNIIFGHSPQLQSDIATIGRDKKHYSIDRRSANFHGLGGGIEGLRGYYKSVRPATCRLLLNVNVTHAVFFKPLRLDNILREFGSRNMLDLAKKLKRVRLQRLHLPPQKNKAGEVIPSVVTFWDFATNNDGFGESNRPQVLISIGAGPKGVKFFLSNSGASSTATQISKATPSKSLIAGKYISVWDYFRQNYPNIKMDENLPVVNVGNREHPCYLPSEACQVLPGQPLGKKLSPDETRLMIEFACRQPKANADSIMGEGRKILCLTPPKNAKLTENGLAVGDLLVTVPARVLVAPQIKYSQNPRAKESKKLVNPFNGSWNMDKTEFSNARRIRSWDYIWVRTGDPQRPGVPKPGVHHYFEDESGLRDKVKNFMAHLQKTGMEIPIPLRRGCMVFIGEEKTTYFYNAVIDKLKEFAMAPPGGRPEFAFIILPFNDAVLYNRIKKFADTQAGIHTVCVVEAKFAKKDREEQYFANVALKFNLKAGGINHTLDAPKLGIISEGKTMVVGIDVTHPSPGSRSNAPSIAGIVASVDKYLGQWPADLRVQRGRQEMVSELRSMLKSRLILWQSKNKSLPEKILVYRDGVSEGQYQIVLDEELPRIREACKELYPPNRQPAISIIIVGKRHHTRFYPVKIEDADRSNNCKNGTIVDRGVTEVRFWHFYLQAHACLQGTARPAHYYVILDEIFRGKKPTNPIHRHAADALEDLTHNMCHLFGRATKAVSICPPAYYADLLCERGRCYLAHLFDPATPGATPAPSVASGGDDSEATDADVKIDGRLKDSMFYI